MTRGFGNAVEDNLPTKFQRHGASEALLTGASPRFFSLPPLGWGRDDLFRVTRRRKRTGRERVHRPKRRGGRSGGKEGAVVVCLLQGTRKIWSKMLGEDSSRVARHVLYVVVGTLLGFVDVIRAWWLNYRVRVCTCFLKRAVSSQRAGDSWPGWIKTLGRESIPRF